MVVNPFVLLVAAAPALAEGWSWYYLNSKIAEHAKVFSEIGNENKQKLAQQQKQDQDKQKESEAEAKPSAEGGRARKSGGGFGDLIKDFQKNQTQWELTATHSEAATGKKARGGTSVQEVYRNKTTGQTIVKHIRYDKNGKKIDEHFRPFAK